MKKVNDNTELQIRSFFESNISIGLFLPDGWFGGRPMENHHKLSFLVVRPNRLILELDDHLLLSFTGDGFQVENKVSKKILQSGTPSLEFKNYQQVTFEYLEYGTRKPNEKTFREGVVCLISGGN